jgi:hypothetical protein
MGLKKLNEAGVDPHQPSHTEAGRGLDVESNATDAGLTSSKPTLAGSNGHVTYRSLNRLES